MHARRALPDQSAALLADLAPRRGRRFPLNAVVRARLAITASREAEATHPTRAVSAMAGFEAQTLCVLSNLAHKNPPDILSACVAAVGRFNPDIGGSSLSSCDLSPRGTYVPVA
eukprot:1993554-Prymnesium_polylepis.1